MPFSRANKGPDETRKADAPHEMHADALAPGSFYGRRVGKPLRAGQQDAIDAILPRFHITPEEARTPQALFATPPRGLWLEIGFGGGEHLLSHAMREPDMGFIGVEPFLNGMACMARALAESGQDNIRLYDHDAALLLEELPNSSLHGADLLYPDPWPKKRHWKRRFVRPDNLDRLARVIRPGGVFRFASDVPHYVGWTLAHIRNHGGFEWLADSAADWTTPYPHWPGTRYEAKALREGRIPSYLTFRRI